MTALHWCAYNNNIDGVKTLLKAVSSCMMMLKWGMTTPVSSYGTPLAQIASYLALHSSLNGPVA